MYVEILDSLMHGGRGSKISINELLKEGHAESPNGFAIKSQNQ